MKDSKNFRIWRTAEVIESTVLSESLPGKALCTACLRSGRLFCAVLRECIRLQRAKQGARSCHYCVNGSKKCRFVSLRWFVEATHLAYILQCRRANLILIHRRLKVEERLDISTHKHYLDMEGIASICCCSYVFSHRRAKLERVKLVTRLFHLFRLLQRK